MSLMTILAIILCLVFALYIAFVILCIKRKKMKFVIVGTFLILGLIAIGYYAITYFITSM